MKHFGKSVGKKKPLLLAGALLLSASILSGCGDSGLVKVKVGEYPNQAASNAKISEEFATGAKALTDSAFQFFREIARIPRQSKSLDKISTYITSFASYRGYSTTTDEAGNIAFDVPATKGYEDYPKIILQAHLDMVVSWSDDNASFDPINDAIHLEEDDESFHSDGKTNIGADDGEGICTLLAIADSDSSTCVHGPLRFLFTTDEDIGLVGAQALDPALLDSNYLINVDASCVGEIIYAAAGSALGEFKTTSEMQTMPEGYSLLEISVSGLKGGHSSLHASQTLLGASKVLINALKTVKTSVQSWYLSSMEAGEVSNAIPTKGSLKVAVPSQSKDEVLNEIKADYNSLKASYPDETSASFNCKEISSGEAKVYGSSTSENTYALLSSLPDGTIDGSEDSQTSSNVSPVSISNGSISVSSLFRSLKNSVLNEAKNNFSSYASQYGFTYSLGTDFLAWEQDKEDSFINLFYNGLKTACGLEGVKSKCAGGLETSLFATKKSGMHMLSIGADVTGEHVISEKLYKKSFPTHMAAILSTLKNINTL